MDIVIVVVSYNSSETIVKSLNSLLDNFPQMYETAIVLVDNNSCDNTVELAEKNFPSIKVVKNPKNFGFGKANNIGMETIGARYYYLHNSDAYLQANILDQAVTYMDKNSLIGAMGFPLVYPDLSIQTSAYSRSTPLKWFLQGLKIDLLAKAVLSKISSTHLDLCLRRFNLTKSIVESYSKKSYESHFFDVDWVCGASMILRKNSLSTIGGGFDEEIFLYGEDEDLCIQLHEKGWRVGQFNTMPVIHDFGWGKHKKKSAVVSKLKFDSLKYFIDKHFKRYTFKWLLMRLFLYMKGKSWGV